MNNGVYCHYFYRSFYFTQCNNSSKIYFKENYFRNYFECFCCNKDAKLKYGKKYCEDLLFGQKSINERLRILKLIE